ncbi:ABC transporter permease subunit [Halorussus salinus]|uniref:ABC transporter permease subunit n=1 Tax=Halorussus salinus TaxID=1364935 RepID=UPI001092A80D|nr:ABC transporter permease subunit [Halorussus salinus]
MNWSVIARKEFRDVRRSKTLWTLFGVVSLVLAVPILTQSGSPQQADLTPLEAALSSLVTLGTLLFPIAVLVTSYDAVTGELESGSATFLLGLPNTRLEAIVGKFVGRTAVTALGFGAAFAIGGVLLLVKFGSVPVATYVAVTALTLYFAAVWTAIGIGISALTGSRGRSLASALGAYLFFVLGWIILLQPRKLAAQIVESMFGLSAMPQLYDFVFRLSPTTAYAFASNGLISGGSETRPFFLQEWFMIIVLLLWLLGPITLGYLRFRTSELAR